MTFSITGYRIEGDMIRVFTDHAERNEFVYKSDRFDSFETLEAEIRKSVALADARSARSSARFESVEAGFVSRNIDIVPQVQP